MHRNVIWSPLSEIDLENTLTYLQKNWNDQVVNNFLDNIENLIEQIAKNPKQFPLVNYTLLIRI